MMLTAGGEALTVVDGDDRVQGLLTLGLIEQLLSEEAAADDAGSNGSPSSLVVHPRPAADADADARAAPGEAGAASRASAAASETDAR